MTKVLRFTHFAWSKLCYLRDKGGTEVGFYGIAKDDDPLYIGDVRMMPQECSACFVEMDGEDMAAMLEEMHEKGVKAELCSRVWIHTHPGDSAQPSGTDEKTFDEVYGQAPWAVMAILARGGQHFARLRFRSGSVQGEVELDWVVDKAHYTQEKEWDAEYDKNVTKKVYQTWTGGSTYHAPFPQSDHRNLPLMERAESLWDRGSGSSTSNGVESDDYYDDPSSARLICIDCTHAWVDEERWFTKRDECPQCGSCCVDYYDDYSAEDIKELRVDLGIEEAK